MKAWTRWQDWCKLVIGVLLFLSPWFFSTTGNTSSSWDAWIIGIVTVIVALWGLALLNTNSSELVSEWASLVLGVWLFIAPWVLGFATIAAAAWTAWILGILLVIASIWVLAQSRGTHTTAAA
jgi:hypothetical protein